MTLKILLKTSASMKIAEIQHGAYEIAMDKSGPD